MSSSRYVGSLCLHTTVFTLYVFLCVCCISKRGNDSSFSFGLFISLYEKSIPKTYRKKPESLEYKVCAKVNEPQNCGLLLKEEHLMTVTNIFFDYIYKKMYTLKMLIIFFDVIRSAVQKGEDI